MAKSRSKPCISLNKGARVALGHGVHKYSPGGRIFKDSAPNLDYSPVVMFAARFQWSQQIHLTKGEGWSDSQSGFMYLSHFHRQQLSLVPFTEAAGLLDLLGQVPAPQREHNA